MVRSSSTDMIKKFTLFMALLFVGAMGAFAQSMTDDQIIAFIQKENAAGTSQQQIVTDLLRKGVTTAQLQRVRRKAEAMKETQKNGGSLIGPEKKVVTRTQYDQHGKPVTKQELIYTPISFSTTKLEQTKLSK